MISLRERRLLRTRLFMDHEKICLKATPKTWCFIGRLTLLGRKEGMLSDLEEFASQITKDGLAWQEAQLGSRQAPDFVY